MKYFTLEEMIPCLRYKNYCPSCKEGLPGISTEVLENIQALVSDVLVPLRERYGNFIYVNSGYRCPKHNREVGGVPNSQHTRGEAADIRCDDLPRLVGLIEEIGKYDQLIIYPTFVHISYKRRGPNRRQKIWKK